MPEVNSDHVNESLPEDIRELVDRCKIGRRSFSKDEMDVALKFGVLLWRRLHKMSQHYERESNYFMPNDIRGQILKQASIDINHVLRDTLNDI